MKRQLSQTSCILTLFVTLLLCLIIVFCITGCQGTNLNAQDPSTNFTSTPAPTTAAPTTQPTPPPTTVPTTAAPTIGPTCPPVEGDQYWGEFLGKGFRNPKGIGEPVSAIMLYSSGSCRYNLSIYSSEWDPTRVWTFDGEYLYIGSIESGTYSTLLYVGAEDPNESKLVFIKSDHDLPHFDRLPDGQEFIFGGIMRWTQE